MQKKLIVVLLSLWCGLFVQAQEKDDWADAKAVVLLDERQVDVANNQIHYRFFRRVLIRNEAGSDYARTSISQSVFVRTKNIKAEIQTPDGRVIRKLAKDDIKTAHYSPGYVLYDDAIYDWFDLRQRSYPYIYQVEYEQDVKSLFFWPDWLPQEDVPVLKSTYWLSIGEDVGYKTQAINLDVQPALEKRGKTNILTWSLDSLKAAVTESYMPPEARQQMALLFAPDNFNLDKFGGSFASWDTFAQWYRDLTAATYPLDAAAAAQVRSIIADAENDRAAVEKLFAFLQNYTRYVAIMPGLSGWQPHSAQSIYTNRYGDCKDLSSLMIAMLKIARVEAYPVLVKTRSRGLLQRDFPSNQFNHAITVVPMQKDTLWLECTSKLLPVDFVPDSYEGCEVVVVKKDGGEIWRTPKSRAADNWWASNITGNLAATGDLVFSSAVKAGGNQGDYYRSSLYGLDKIEEKNWLQRFVSRFQPNIAVEKYSLSNMTENFRAPAEIRVQGNIAKFAKRSANRLFFNPNIIMRYDGDDIPKEEKRQFPLYFKYAYSDRDTLRLSFPAGFELEAAPDTLSISTNFASFRSTFRVNGNELLYVRHAQIDSSLIPVSDYGAFQEFIKAVVKNDRSQFVLRKAL